MKIDRYQVVLGIAMFGSLIPLTALNSGWSQLYLYLLAYLLSWPLIVFAMTEFLKSGNIDTKEKVKWSFAFVFVPLFTGFYYLASRRKYVRG